MGTKFKLKQRRKREKLYKLLFLLAPLTRLERATCGLGIRCSIHLSYRGAESNYRTLFFLFQVNFSDALGRTRREIYQCLFFPNFTYRARAVRVITREI